MTIAQFRQRGNSLLAGIPKDLLVALVVILASSASFGLGIYTAKDLNQTATEAFRIDDISTSTKEVLGASAMVATQKILETGTPGNETSVAQAGSYVASKNGTKYYLASCKGAKRIKDENKIWFTTLEEAKASGRTPASTCPGL